MRSYYHDMKAVCLINFFLFKGSGEDNAVGKDARDGRGGKGTRAG